MADHRSGRRFDDVGQMRVREPAAERVNGRRGENNVTDLSKPDQKNSHHLMNWVIW